MITFKVSISGVLKSVVSDTIRDTIKIPAVVDGITVKAIDALAFRKNSTLKSISIPKTVKKLNTNCFNECASLETVIFEKGSQLERIEDCCFCNCENLTNFQGDIKNLRYIGSKAFYGCKKLKSLDLKDTSISDIFTSTFDRAGIKDIQLPETVKHIYPRAFKHTDVDIDFNNLPNLSVIEEKAFMYSKIKAVDLQSNKSSTFIIKGEAFSDCNNLETVSLPKATVLAGSHIFARCKHLRNATIKIASRVIPPKTFEDCTNLSLVDILQSNIECIGAEAFKGCTYLMSIALPKSIKHVDHGAFANCNLSDKVDLSRVGSDFVLGHFCFYNTWISLKAIKLDYLNPITLKGDPFYSSNCSLEMFKKEYPFVIIEEEE